MFAIFRDIACDNRKHSFFNNESVKFNTTNSNCIQKYIEYFEIFCSSRDVFYAIRNYSETRTKNKILSKYTEEKHIMDNILKVNGHRVNT